MLESSMPITERPQTVDNEKRGRLHIRWWRRFTQTAMLAVMGQWSFYGIFRCPFIVPYVSCQNCPVLTCHGRLFSLFWGFWLLLPLSILLFGRMFCGWACPGGLAVQLAAKWAPFKLHRSHFFIRRLLPWGKYIGLALALSVWLVLGQPREAIPIRVGDFFNSVGLTIEHANLVWIIRTGCVLTMLALGLLVAGVWCRFACPTGGLLEALKGIAVFKVYKTDDCNNCDRCLQMCEMGTRPAESNCTNCGDCLSTCPQNAIHIGRPSKKR